MKNILKINENLPEDRNRCLWRQSLATVASCLISMCSGLTFGISSVMLPQLREDQTIDYNPDHDSWIASIVTLSMIVGSLGCGPILDSYGRRAAHIILGIPFIIGWIVIASAGSTTTVLVGRFITGISSGANKAVSLVYIGEIADPKIRAVALFLPGINTFIGIMTSHILGYYVPWKLSSMICVVPAVASLFIFLFLKESPLWLIAKGRLDEGIDTFRWFRGTDSVSENELKTVLERQSEKPKMSSRETLKIVCTRSFIKPMLILMVVMQSLQFSGVNILRSYSQDVFERTFSGNVEPFVLTMTMDCIRGAIPVACCLLEKFVSRRTAFLASGFALPICVAGLVACLIIDFPQFLWISLFCLVMYMCFSSVLIAIGWTFVPELLPSNARGVGSGLNSGLAYIILFAALKTTPDIMVSLGAPILFVFYGTSTLICGIILWFVLPETNGKTLQSIEDTYSKKKQLDMAL